MRLGFFVFIRNASVRAGCREGILPSPVLLLIQLEKIINSNGRQDARPPDSQRDADVTFIKKRLFICRKIVRIIFQ